MFQLSGGKNLKSDVKGLLSPSCFEAGVAKTSRYVQCLIHSCADSTVALVVTCVLVIRTTLEYQMRNGCDQNSCLQPKTNPNHKKCAIE
jgi:hypothetical protein